MYFCINMYIRNKYLFQAFAHIQPILFTFYLGILGGNLGKVNVCSFPCHHKNSTDAYIFVSKTYTVTVNDFQMSVVL